MMKKGLVSIATGCVLAFSTAAYAAGDMAGMDMGGN
ncbi:RND transporter, partial [Paraburkholderia sp. SIMBA_049]